MNPSSSWRFRLWFYGASCLLIIGLVVLLVTERNRQAQTIERLETEAQAELDDRWRAFIDRQTESQRIIATLKHGSHLMSDEIIITAVNKGRQLDPKNLALRHLAQTLPQ